MADYSHPHLLPTVIFSALLLLVSGQRGTVWACDRPPSNPPGTSTTRGTDEIDTEHISSFLDRDAPEVWATVNSFSTQPSPQNTAAAFALLDEVLAVWSSHPPGLVTTILDAIAKHRLESGRRYLSRFAHVDPQQPHATYLVGSAARALGKMGGSEALDELVWLAEEGPVDAAPTVAFALGEIGDRRAIPTLEILAQQPDPRVKSRALSALAEYCVGTSVRLVIDDMSHPDSRVRNSAAWWLAKCGGAEHASDLAALLDDTDSLVRGNALKGLLRLGSKVACGKVEELLDDDSVVELARDYATICETP